MVKKFIFNSIHMQGPWSILLLLNKIPATNHPFSPKPSDLVLLHIYDILQFELKQIDLLVIITCRYIYVVYISEILGRGRIKFL